MGRAVNSHATNEVATNDSTLLPTSGYDYGNDPPMRMKIVAEFIHAGLDMLCRPIVKLSLHCCRIIRGNQDPKL